MGWTLTDVRRELTLLQLDNHWPTSVALTDDELQNILEKATRDGVASLEHGVVDGKPTPADGPVPVVLWEMIVVPIKEEPAPEDRFGYIPFTVVKVEATGPCYVNGIASPNLPST